MRTGGHFVMQRLVQPEPFGEGNRDGRDSDGRPITVTSVLRFANAPPPTVPLVVEETRSPSATAGGPLTVSCS